MSALVTWSDFSRCGVRGSGLDIQYNEKSVTADWLRAPQTLEIWVFPADTPITGSAGPADPLVQPDPGEAAAGARVFGELGTAVQDHVVVDEQEIARP